MDPRLSEPKSKNYAGKHMRKLLEKRLEPQLLSEVQDELTNKFKEEFSKRGWEGTICRKHGTPLEIETEYNDHPGEAQPYTAKTIVSCPKCKKEELE